jgi:hypothetical protein
VIDDTVHGNLSIFTDNVDNVRILCLSCKVKKSKTTATLPENIRNKRHSDRLPWTVSSRRLFLIFSGKVAVVLDFLTLQDKHNIRTLSTWIVKKEKNQIIFYFISGFSLNERFLYYGILAVGFVLLLISSILCNVCINDIFRQGSSCFGLFDHAG